jgi:hypothetical protein
MKTIHIFFYKDSTSSRQCYHLSTHETPPPHLSIVTPHNKKYRKPVNSPNSQRFATC